VGSILWKSGQQYIKNTRKTLPTGCLSIYFLENSKMLNSWFHKGLAMILDEVVVLDRALETDEILAYLTAVKALAKVGFPVGQASD
jgi:hypothetical protein